jgi:hypothetical protein
MSDRDKVRYHLAWLMWCFHQGYIKAEDRVGMENWLLDDPATLHPADAALVPYLLEMADEVLRLVAVLREVVDE